MGIHNDIYRAASDPNYRMMYEWERTQETLARTAPKVQNEIDREKKKKAEEDIKNKKKTDEDAKVICTELVRQGLLGRADYLAGARYVEEHLTDRHMRGYHAWALPVVRHMRRSRRATAFWRVLAQARADHIAFLNGDTSRRSRLGALLCAIGHPVCYLIGGLVREPDWRALYRGDTAPERS